MQDERVNDKQFGVYMSYSSVGTYVQLWNYDIESIEQLYGRIRCGMIVSLDINDCITSHTAPKDMQT
jgi:hypothetical protein